MSTPPKLALPDRLKYLVKYCEVNCVAECCGIDAFDFSPLHVALHLSAFSGRITEIDISAWQLELKKAEDLVVGLPADHNDYFCSIEGMNQYFTRAEFENLIAQLSHSIRVSRQVVEFADKLRLAPKRHPDFVKPLPSCLRAFVVQLVDH